MGQMLNKPEKFEVQKSKYMTLICGCEVHDGDFWKDI